MLKMLLYVVALLSARTTINNTMKGYHQGAAVYSVVQLSWRYARCIAN